MNAEEYANLERVERTHWYYAGKRELVARWLRRVGALHPAATLLDCGAGTGIFAEEIGRECLARVSDDHGESLEILRRRFPAERIVEGSITALPVDTGTYDIVTALDVLEHVPDDRGSVAEMQRVLKPGGIALVTVPAMMSLWSDWDVGLHHQRRYHAPELQALFAGEGWEIVHWNYTNVAVYPLVRLVRWWQKRRPPSEGRRAEDKVPVAWLNKILRTIFVGTGLLRSPKFPGGVSLLLVARKVAVVR